MALNARLLHGRGPAFSAQARRESNPQPPVLETGALPIELRTSELILLRLAPITNGQGQSRTADTAVFSRVLYHLSYLAPTLFVILPYKPNAAKGGVWAK